MVFYFRPVQCSPYLAVVGDTAEHAFSRLASNNSKNIFLSGRTYHGDADRDLPNA